MNRKVCTDSGLCQCPIGTKTYKFKNAKGSVPNIFGKMSGRFEIVASVIDRKGEETFGCMKGNVTIER